MDPSSLKILESSDPEKADHLRNMILACIELLPEFQEDLFRWDVETELDFSPEWGFGSSSTLTALLAEWAEVNPLDLHFMTSEGSGYDVACAIADGPIFYKLRDQSPQYHHVPFHPPFSEQIYFAWLGTKQSSSLQVERFAERVQPDYQTIHHFSTMTEGLMDAEDLITFQELLKEHEKRLSDLLEMEMIATSRFPELPGAVKSLGAWGGDFIMIASDASEQDLYSYLYEKDIKIIYRYQDLVYNGLSL
jgi:mevalonate kinase